MTAPISIRKKLAFSLGAMVGLGFALLIVGELGWRLAYGIPITLFPSELPPATTTGAIAPAEDGGVTDFGSIHYYEIFHESENPILGYEPRPGFSRGAVTINTHGMREREIPREKPTGIRRVAVLGDSIVWGHGIRIDETLPRQLEGMLNAEDRVRDRWEVLNFGVSGYSLQQEVELYESKASAFSPDVVVLVLSVNDHLYSSVEGDFFDQRASGLLQRSFLLERLGLGLDMALHRWAGIPVERLERLVDVERHLQRIRELTEGLGLLVVVMPALQRLDSYPREHLEIMLGPARALGIPAVTPLDALAERRAEAIGVDHIHPSRLGNAVAARATLDALTHYGLMGTP